MTPEQMLAERLTATMMPWSGEAANNPQMLARIVCLALSREVRRLIEAAYAQGGAHELAIDRTDYSVDWEELLGGFHKCHLCLGMGYLLDAGRRERDD